MKFASQKNFRGTTLFLTLLFLFLSRFLFLGTSARFVWDESDDLLRMKQIYDQRRITLVGPISESQVNIYGSLSYYMLMPFAALFHFDPIGPVIGTAFYNLLLVLILSLILHQHFHWPKAATLLFLTPIFPFLQSGRWAWNPHFVPFWQILSLFLIFKNFQKPKWYWSIFAGFFQGLTIHNHWYAFFSFVGFTFVFFILSVKEKNFRNLIFFLLGEFLSLLPFILFDIKNPPGLFLTRFLYFGPFAQFSHQSLNLSVLLNRILKLMFGLINYFFQNKLIAFLFIPPLIFYVFFVLLKTKNFLRKLLLIPIFVQILGLSLTGPHLFDHYLLPAVTFFLLFLMIPDEEKCFSKFQIFLLTFLFLLSLKPSLNEIRKNTWMTNINRTRKITEIIAQNIQGKKYNLFVAASPDLNSVGKRYRDLLKVKGIPIMEKEEYRNYEFLFVISTSDLTTIQKDPAYELNLIRGEKPIKEWKVDQSDWILYQFKAGRLLFPD